jgi:hypothetical protein
MPCAATRLFGDGQFHRGKRHSKLRHRPVHQRQRRGKCRANLTKSCTTAFSGGTAIGSENN